MIVSVYRIPSSFAGGQTKGPAWRAGAPSTSPTCTAPSTW